MAAKPDILLVNPRSRKRVYQKLGDELAAIENPVWAGLMATFCRGKGLNVEILDAEALELDHTEVASEVESIDPTLVVVVVYGHQPSASTQIMPACSGVVSAVKGDNPRRPVLMAGGHVAALPDRTMQDEECDWVASGEGLFTMVSLVRELQASGPFDPEKVPGLWYRDGSKIRVTPNPPLCKDLDNEIPGIAWDLLPTDSYRAHNWHCLDGLVRQPYAAIYTTLGCPYHCSFCCIQAPFKSGERELGIKQEVNSYRFWSVDAVLSELGKLAEMGVKNIKIADEMFVLNKRHVMGICDGIIERGFDFNFWAYARIDTVKDGMLPRMKQAGFNWLALGIEAANDRVQADANKRFDNAEIYRVCREIQEHGIHIIGNYIFGLPEDDHASMRETLDMALELNCEFANFYSAMAYPGSPLYQMALKEGWELPDSWGGYSQHSVDCKPLPTKYLSAAEVLAFRDAAFNEYFQSPSYLDLVRRKFGQPTVDHLADMCKHTLKRELLGTAETSEAAA